MKLATTTGDFGEYTISQQDCLRYIRQAGFRYADYNFGMDLIERTGVYADNWKEYIEDVNRTAAELGIKLVQSHAPMGKPLVHNEDHPQFVADTKRCIEACALMGIPNLVVHSGYIHGITKEECFDRNRDFFMDLLTFAEPFGVNILVENFNRMCVDGLYWIDNAPDLRALIDHVNHPLFHAVWDAGHANMQEMPQDEALRIVGHHVYALHVQDNFGDGDNHIAPFFGTLNLDSLMYGLIDIGYNGYFTFEAGHILLSPEKRRPFDKDQRLLRAPLSLRIKAEELLYEIGKATLEAYGCFEE